MAGGHSPGEETAGALFLVNGGGGVPGVDIGLGELAGAAARAAAAAAPGIATVESHLATSP